jgi:hypothetical protein
MRIYIYTAVILFANVVLRIFLSGKLNMIQQLRRCDSIICYVCMSVRVGIQYFVFLQVPQMEIEQVLPPADHDHAHHAHTHG